jgi:dihydrofolate synthase/folylpolyglutamate synthase
MSGVFSDVVVAVCDVEIKRAIESYGGRVIMTSPTHPGATDRVSEAADHLDCTHVVMEVGLGGLKDATNVIDDRDKVAVITDIGLDHTRILGDTLEKIAFQKAGIIKSGNNVFCYDQNKILNDVIDKQVKESKAILHRLDEVELHRNARLNSDLPDYQKRNWLLAQQVAEFVINRDGLNKLDTEILLDSQKTIIPARLQHVQIGNKTLVIDGAHNPQKLNALVSSLKKLFPDKSYALLIAFMESKQATLDVSLTILHSISDNVITTEFMASTDLPHKVMPSTELVSGCKKAGFSRVQSIKNTDDAFEELLKQPEDIILITGSFYLIGSLVDKVRQYIHG